MADALELIRTRGARTPQAEQADPRQKANNAGGYAFTIPGEARISRFLTLGVEGGTFYVKPRALTMDNGSVLLDWARNRSAELVAQAAEVSVAGRAPRNDPALFAVMAAMSEGNLAGRRAAAAAFGEVARTGTHLFTAAKYAEQFGGWGPLTRRAFARWYLDKDADALAYQLIKYRHRHDWRHADILAMAHPKPRRSDGTLMADHDRLFAWLAGRDHDAALLPAWVLAFERAREIERGSGTAAAKAAAYVKLIQDNPGLPWEALPDEAVSQADVWRALIDAGLPQTALLRNLPKLTILGVLAPMSDHLAKVCGQLRDPARLLKARVHPVAVLLALRTYAQGHSEKGDSRWTPVPQVTDALNDAFYAAFPAVQPAGKRIMGCTDLSASMTWSIAGYPFTAVEVVGAMAMVQMATEPRYGIYGFSTELAPLQVSPGMRLDTVMRAMRGGYHGGTDCAAPMVWALRNRVEADIFQVFTDSETWYGSIHPHQALEDYRQKMGIDARLQVIAVAPTEFSIADPDDPRQLDVSGFSSDVPALLANHGRGDI
jgi:60 kDa SS-A/Ro ribonucleoprotein